MIRNLGNKITHKTLKTKTIATIKQQKKNWITPTCCSPLMREVTDLCKHTGVNIAFRATSNLYSHLRNKAPQDKGN
jgi:hypothetical protein